MYLDKQSLILTASLILSAGAVFPRLRQPIRRRPLMSVTPAAVKD